MPTPTYLSNLSQAVFHCAEYYGERYIGQPDVVRATLAADVLEIWTQERVTWRYAVHTFDRRIGNDVEGYAASITGGN